MYFTRIRVKDVLMKNLFIVFFLSLLHFFSFGQNWEWAKAVHFPFASNLGGIHSCIDQSGNFYVAGYNWDPNYGYPAGSAIIKFDQWGNELWRKLFTNKIRIYKIQTDLQGNILVAGDFMDTVHLDGNIYFSENKTDGFLCSLNPSGTLQWFNQLAGQKDENARDIYVDGNGHFFLTGMYSNNSTIKGIQLNTYGKGSSYIMKFEADGNLLSIITTNDTDTNSLNYGYRIRTDSIGNIYLLGEHNAIQIDTFSIHSYGWYGARYFAKFDSAGNLMFLKDLIHGTTTFKNFCVSNEEIYFTGDGGWTNGGWTRTDKYSPEGNLLWSKINNGFYFEYSSNNIVPHNSGFYTIGHEGDSNVPSWNTIYSLLLSHYLPDGTQTLTRIPSIGRAVGLDITTTGNNSYMIVGSSSDTITFGNTTITQSEGNVFIAKFNDNTSSVIEFKKPGQRINIFPNPSSGQFTIQLSVNTSEGEICVYDLLGNCILNQMITSSSDQLINLKEKSKGIYFVELKTGKERIRKKVIVN
jgi:hypothetical protein